MSELLVVDNLDFSYNDGKTVFKDISFKIKSNTITALLGPNNCGKTTLINILSGNILSNDSVKNNSCSKKDIAVLYCNTNKRLKFNNLRLLMEYQLRSHDFSIKDSNKQLLYISQICGVKEILNKRISKLNKIDKLKALIAASIVFVPKVLLIDDLFDNLDLSEINIIIELLKNINDNIDTAIVFTTRKLDPCVICDNIYFLNNETVEFYGDFDFISSRDNVLSRNGILISTMLDLSLKLKDYDLLDSIILEPDRMVDELWK